MVSINNLSAIGFRYFSRIEIKTLHKIASNLLLHLNKYKLTNKYCKITCVINLQILL